MDNEQLYRDFVKSVDFAAQQLGYLIELADKIIYDYDLDSDARGDVIEHLIRLMEAA